MLAWVQDRLSGLIELHTSVAEGEWPGPGGHGDRARPALRLADSRFRAGLGVRGTRWDPRRSRARRTGRPCRQNGRLPSQASAEPDPFCRSSAFITGASSRSASCPEMNGSANGGISAGYPFARVRAASDPGAAAAHSGGSGRGYQRNLRDVSSQQTGGRLNMQPSGLMNISAWSENRSRIDSIPYLEPQRSSSPRPWASIAIGTNLPFGEWGIVFPDPLVAAIVDRSPSTPTSSRPAPSPTGSAPPRPPASPRIPPDQRPVGAEIRAADSVGPNHLTILTLVPHRGRTGGQAPEPGQAIGQSRGRRSPSGSRLCRRY